MTPPSLTPSPSPPLFPFSHVPSAASPFRLLLAPRSPITELERYRAMACFPKKGRRAHSGWPRVTKLQVYTQRYSPRDLRAAGRTPVFLPPPSVRLRWAGYEMLRSYLSLRTCMCATMDILYQQSIHGCFCCECPGLPCYGQTPAKAKSRRLGVGLNEVRTAVGRVSLLRAHARQ